MNNMIQMHEQKSIPNGPWDTLKSKVDFDLPSKDRSSFYSEYMDLLNYYLSSQVNRHILPSFHNDQSYVAKEILDALSEDGDFNSFNHSSKKNNNISTQLKQCLIPLLLVGHYNNVDLARLLIEQYQSSNLSTINQYISRSSLFDEMEANRNIDLAEKNKVKNMLTNYLKCYTKYIEKPIPGHINDIPSTFKPFNDKIDNVLLYFSKLNFCINQQNMIKTRPIQFDVYFVPPNTTNDLDDLKVAGMIKSCPNKRFGSNQGTEEIYHLLQSQQAQKLLDPVDNTRNKRVILLIVRKNINNTNYDILYLFVDSLPYDLAQKSCFKYNELLWKLNTKRDIIDGKLNVDDCKYSTNYNLFSISYHLKSKPSSINSYFYFNGFGSKITKQDIFSKWSLMFGSKHGDNEISYNISISNLFSTKYNETHSRDNQQYNNNEFGQYLFGLSYSFCSYQKTSRQTLTFPKDVLQHGLKQIAEFDEQQQLYYYLTWSCKMQLIHQQYLHFTLKHRQPKEIAIFNTELTDANSKNILYIVAILNDKNNGNNYYRGGYHNNNNNKPKWKMNAFMTAQQIYNIYGLNEKDLPKGSRALTNYFQQDINKHYQQITNNNIEKVRNWNHIEKVCSQQFRHNTPRFNDYDLNQAIKESLDNIRGKYNNLELIPILNIDTKRDTIRVEALIPIKIRNRWIAISYKKATRSYNKAVVNQLFIDQDDIINKASLVDPKQFHDLQWLKGNNYASYNRYNNNNTQTTFMRYKPKTKTIISSKKNKSNNNNNNMRPKLQLTNEESGNSVVSAASTIGSLGSLGSVDTDNTFPSLQLNHSISSQTMMSATPAFTNNDSNTSSNNNGNNNNGNNPTETIMVGQLRQQLNDALTMARSVFRDSQMKDQLISQQEQQIKQLQQQIKLQQQKLLLASTGLPPINTSMPYIPSCINIASIPQIPSPMLHNNNSNVSNASNTSNTSNNDNNTDKTNGNNNNNTIPFSNTPSPIGSNGSNNNNNNNNNIVSNNNNMSFPNTLFPVHHNNINVLSVANQFGVPPAPIPAFGPTNSFSLTNNTPPASINNNAVVLTIPNYSMQPNSNSNSPQMPFTNTQF